MTIWIYTGDRPSNGAKALAAYAGFGRLRAGKITKIKDTIVNWGVGKAEVPFGIKMLNSFYSVSITSNKLTAFKKMADIKCVPWTDQIDTVRDWLEDGSTVVVRTKLTGHSGDGIIIIEKNAKDIDMAPLYTKYIWKEKEYRVHVVAGNVVDTQRKIKDPKQEVKNWKVRSHSNGFIFARNNIEPSVDRDSLAVGACAALGLDFGAVDIVEDKHGGLFVLEVNTAPGLEGQTIESYRAAFAKYNAHE